MLRRNKPAASRALLIRKDRTQGRADLLGRNAVLSPFDNPHRVRLCRLLSCPQLFTPSIHHMTQDQIKDLKGRAEALRRYL